MRFALLASVLSLSALGCGGSSSETPPPLLPDPTSERYTGPRMPGLADDVTVAAAPEAEADDTAELPRKPAAATWGSGKPATSSGSKAPASPPQMTSPTALPSSSATPTRKPAPAGSSTAPRQPETLPDGFEF